VPIDNNLSEREMKRVVLNRTNSLFVGNPRGGRTAAILASLTSTCRRHEIDPQLYPNRRKAGCCLPADAVQIAAD
jgi:transposase